MNKVLFVCIENSCRSQMAEGFAKEREKNVLEVYSAGTHPSGTINPMAIAVMREIGIDIAHQRSKGFKDLPVNEFDYVVTMGCQDVCPFVPGKEYLEWHISDPEGNDIEFFRKIRDEIAEKLEKFIATIKEKKSGDCHAKTF